MKSNIWGQTVQLFLYQHFCLVCMAKWLMHWLMITLPPTWHDMGYKHNKFWFLGRPLGKTFMAACFDVQSVSQSVSECVKLLVYTRPLHRSYLFNAKTDQVHMWCAFVLQCGEYNAVDMLGSKVIKGVLLDQYIEILLTWVLYCTISCGSLDQLQVTYVLEVVLFCLVA